MITKEKLEEYMWADGDIDGYCGSGRKKPITDAESRFLDHMVTAITIIRRGLVVDSFRKEHDETVSREFDSRATYEEPVKYEMKSEQGGGECVSPAAGSPSPHR